MIAVRHDRVPAHRWQLIVGVEWHRLMWKVTVIPRRRRLRIGRLSR